ARAGDDGVEIDRLRRQQLLAREGEELRGQPRAALRRPGRTAQRPARRLVVDALLSELDVAENDMQQVVEVMRHAARQLADRFELLRLPQSVLGALALGD